MGYESHKKAVVRLVRLCDIVYPQIGIKRQKKNEISHESRREVSQADKEVLFLVSHFIKHVIICFAAWGRIFRGKVVGRLKYEHQGTIKEPWGGLEAMLSQKGLWSLGAIRMQEAYKGLEKLRNLKKGRELYEENPQRALRSLEKASIVTKPSEGLAYQPSSSSFEISKFQGALKTYIGF